MKFSSSSRGDAMAALLLLCYAAICVAIFKILRSSRGFK
jgi:hypothetical protein